MTDRNTYVMALHVPIYLDGSDLKVATDWKRSLELLRDSLHGHFQHFVYLAPFLDIHDAAASQTLTSISESDDGWHLIPVFNAKCSKRGYWLEARRKWRRAVKAAFADARVAHTGLSDLYRPINYDALRLGLASPATCVLVRDTDEFLKHKQLRAAGLGGDKLHQRLHAHLQDRAMRHAVRRADLTMLKGGSLFERYRQDAKNAVSFEDTSYSVRDIVGADWHRRRVASLQDHRPLAFVYCGRFERRKGVDHAIRIVAGALAAGADVTLDLIGDGAERPALQALVSSLQLGEHVRFLGRREYDRRLLSDLAHYDALLFTPRGEDTPRMIFDGYCAGLPLVAYNIDYVRERELKDKAVVCLPLNDINGSATIVQELEQNRAHLGILSASVREAAAANTAERWYARRAEWTLSACGI